jgi:hypothetical protein
MADTKTTNLPENTSPTLNDLFMMVDVDDPTMSEAGSNVKVPGTEIVELLLETLAARVQPINVQTGTSYTLTLSDSGALLVFNNAGDIELTIPEDASTDHENGTYFDGIQAGVGQIYFIPEGGIASYRTREQGARFKIQKLGDNSWHIGGNIEAVA